MEYNPKSKEQIIELKDGRTIFKTHNGFKSFMKNQKGIIIPITEKYYLKVKRNKT